MGTLSWLESYGEKMFRTFDMSKLTIDTAYLNVTNVATSQTLGLYSKYLECYQCSYHKDDLNLTDGQHIINTHYPKLYQIVREDNKKVLCALKPEFGQFGVYSLQVTDDNCSLSTLKEPVNIYFPILTVLLIYLALFVVCVSVYTVCDVYMRKDQRDTTSDDEFLKKSSPSKRLRSLDAFRGLTIVCMLFANFGCGGYRILDHAVWNGIQFADFVFPWFTWIMGVCVPISLSAVLRKGTPKRNIMVNIIQRSCSLFAMGLFLSSGTNLETLRVMGVLQRLAVSYFATATIFTIFTNASNEPNKPKTVFQRVFYDIFFMKYQWSIGLIMVVVHTIITFGLSVPNCPTGYIGPGGYHQNGQHENCTGGAAGYIDRQILGKHVLSFSSTATVYKSIPHDPEGMLGSLTSIFQTILGAQAGITIMLYKQHSSRLIRWLLWTLTLGLIGGLLCGFTKEEGIIPINKDLWSLSMVLVTSSLAYLVLAAFYYLIDVQDVWTGKPFTFAGTNSILMFAGHTILYYYFPIRWVPEKDGFRTHLMKLTENLWATVVWLLIAYFLYRKKYFLKL